MVKTLAMGLRLTGYFTTDEGWRFPSITRRLGFPVAKNTDAKSCDLIVYQ
jgi:hypothetical protein